jgi:hypothetical protein
MSFTVDLTMNASMDTSETTAGNSHDSLVDEPMEDTTNFGDEERGLVPLSFRSSRAGSSSPVGDTELQTRPHSIASSTGNFIKRKTSQLFEAVTSTSSTANKPLTPKLAGLVESYVNSDIAASIQQESDELRRETARSAGGRGRIGRGNELRDVTLETTLLRGRKRASWGTQFRILSGRAFKNLYRDPALLAAHYLSSIALACECCPVLIVDRLFICSRSSVICGLFFHNVT